MSQYHPKRNAAAQHEICDASSLREPSVVLGDHEQVRPRGRPPHTASTRVTSGDPERQACEGSPEVVHVSCRMGRRFIARPIGKPWRASGPCALLALWGVGPSVDLVNGELVATVLVPLVVHDMLVRALQDVDEVVDKTRRERAPINFTRDTSCQLEHLDPPNAAAPEGSRPTSSRRVRSIR